MCLLRLVLCLPRPPVRMYICEGKGTAINVQTGEQSTAGGTEGYQGLSPPITYYYY